jgi:predicted DNA-binding transcriptional regulator AlpA
VPLLNVSQVAERCGVSISFLNKLRTKGGGPPYLKLGHAVRYLDSKLDDWIAAQERRSTSETSASREARASLNKALARTISKPRKSRKQHGAAPLSPQP